MTRSATALALVSLALAACPSSKPVDNTPKLADEGATCKKDDACKSGLCAQLPGDKSSTCRRHCGKNLPACKTGEVCTAFKVSNDGTPVGGCAPERPGLCQPCVADSDCPYPADACVKIGESDPVCGRDCSTDGRCPEGFVCSDSLSPAGQPLSNQCVPSSGTCACVAGTVGVKVPCEVANLIGRCTGNRTCQDDFSFSACDALIPANESCNGVDDNCNGQTDEGIPDQTCGLGECKTTAPGCVNGAPPACVPLPSVAEVCNGKDDDCDGKTDEDFDLMTDPHNCGTCGTVCTVDHGIAGCAQGACTVATCEYGWGDCNLSAADGCETNTRTSLTHCGSCGAPCQPPAHGTTNCVNGACAPVCTAPWKDCNLKASDGCESNTTTDVANCGSCGNACPLGAHASGKGCSASTCTQTCNNGWANCDGNAANGCERGLDTRAAPPQCGSPIDLGSLDGDQNSADVIRSGHDERTFKIHMNEGSSSCTSVTASFTLISPNGADYDLRTYFSPCPASETLANYGGVGGVEEIDTCKCDDCFGGDSGYDVFIEINFVSGSSCDDWSLVIHGNAGKGCSC